MGPLARILILLVWGIALPAWACAYPDEGNTPLRRAVTRIQLLPEIDAWASAMHKTGAAVQYAVLLEETVRENGRCYWTVEVRADGELWRRFLVTPDGRSILPKKH